MRCFFFEGETRRDFDGEAGGGVAGLSIMIGRAARGGELLNVSNVCMWYLT